MNDRETLAIKNHTKRVEIRVNQKSSKNIDPKETMKLEELIPGQWKIQEYNEKYRIS